MHTYISSKEDLKEVVSEAIEATVSQRLPEVIHRATRKKYYTIQQVCDLLDVSRRHLQYLRNTNQITYIKSGKKIYFRAEDLEEFFESNLIPSNKKTG